MPTFYFGLWDGYQLDPDEQGVELRGTEEAFEMAVQSARQMLAEAQPKGEDRSSWAFRVHDEQGRPSQLDDGRLPAGRLALYSRLAMRSCVSTASLPMRLALSLWPHDH